MEMGRGHCAVRSCKQTVSFGGKSLRAPRKYEPQALCDLCTAEAKRHHKQRRKVCELEHAVRQDDVVLVNNLLRRLLVASKFCVDLGVLHGFSALTVSGQLDPLQVLSEKLRDCITNGAGSSNTGLWLGHRCLRLHLRNIVATLLKNLFERPALLALQ
eukprot:5925644-Amphidinium_carterae.3